MPDSRVLDALRTRDAMEQMEGPQGTSDLSFHTTCVASKAIGTTLGSSKKAILVPVKLGTRLLSSYLHALWEITYDITHNGRQRKAVVFQSSSTPILATASDMERTYAINVWRALIMELISHGVPVISTSGNQAQELNHLGQQRTNIDTMPSLLASEVPMIPVGSLLQNGELHPFSQRGPLLVTNAVGTDIQCIDKVGNLHLKSGSSLCKFT